MKAFTSTGKTLGQLAWGQSTLVENTRKNFSSTKYGQRVFGAIHKTV